MRSISLKNPEFVTSIPGIGFITASQLIAQIGDWKTQVGNTVVSVENKRALGCAHREKNAFLKSETTILKMSSATNRNERFPFAGISYC